MSIWNSKAESNQFCRRGHLSGPFGDAMIEGRYLISTSSLYKIYLHPAGMHRAAFFASGRGRESNPQGRVTVKLGAFSEWGGAGQS